MRGRVVQVWCGTTTSEHVNSPRGQQQEYLFYLIPAKDLMNM